MAVKPLLKDECMLTVSGISEETFGLIHHDLDVLQKDGRE